MSTVLVNTPAALQFEPLDSRVASAPATSGFRSQTVNTIDDLLVSRAQIFPDVPLVGYPVAGSRASYTHYTPRDLDRFTDETVKYFFRQGLALKSSAEPYTEVVALLAPSNLDYVSSIFALSRMGFSVLLLSNRLATEAYVSLLEKTKCRTIIFSKGNRKAVAAISEAYETTSYDIPQQSDYDLAKPSGPRYTPHFYTQAVSTRTAFIIHSSGSTGLPKPIFQTHGACLSNYSSGSAYRSFVTLPLYHNHGLSTFFRAVYSCNEVSLYNATLPLSETNLVEAMESVKPQSFHGVPYALKLLGESERGISTLRDCKIVWFGGSSCPDDLGDKLVNAGVYLVAHYGATEIGQLMTSIRPSEDKAWNYVRPLLAVKPYIRMVERSPGVYECVVLDGLPTKVISNSSDPPNSFCTSDTFSPHPSIPDAWKYLGRLDDRVTLVNGEKVLPIPYEHQIREHELVKEACVFGIGRAFPGLIIIPSDKAAGRKKAEILEELMPVVQAANARVEGFSQISREMIELFDVGAEYPSTDKGTIIRAAFYKKYEDLISSLYTRFETQALDSDVAPLALELKELESYLLDVFTNKLNIEDLQPGTDFFEAGLDSLQAITSRALMMRELDLGGQVLGQNVVFEFGNVKKLAQHLYSLRTGNSEDRKNELELMSELIEKYSHFSQHTPGPNVLIGETIVLTGATGSLGAHILAQLARKDNVKTIYCLVRASNPEAGQARVVSTLQTKGLDPDVITNKAICLPADLSRPDLGLDAITIETLKSSLTTVIHSAWAVNFNLGVQSFESHHIGGVHNLLSLCLSTTSKKPARLFFCSSISAAAGTPIPARIKETYVADPAHAQNMGYARSKYVAEHIIRRAVAQTTVDAEVLRVGQIIGDTKKGIWNPSEAIPLMIRSAVTIGALPALEETPAWLPVDEVARAVIDLSGIDRTETQQADPSIVYHLQNPRTFHWTQDLLPALHNAGLEFETVSQREWVHRLRTGEQDPEKNPTIKLIDFFTEKYDNDLPGRKGLVFETTETAKSTGVVKDGFDVVGSGLVGRMVEAWRETW